MKVFHRILGGFGRVPGSLVNWYTVPGTVVHWCTGTLIHCAWYSGTLHHQVNIGSDIAKRFLNWSGVLEKGAGHVQAVQVIYF